MARNLYISMIQGHLRQRERDGEEEGENQYFWEKQAWHERKITKQKSHRSHVKGLLALWNYSFIIIKKMLSKTGSSWDRNKGEDLIKEEPTSFLERPICKLRTRKQVLKPLRKTFFSHFQLCSFHFASSQITKEKVGYLLSFHK